MKAHFKPTCKCKNPITHSKSVNHAKTQCKHKMQQRHSITYKTAIDEDEQCDFVEVTANMRQTRVIKSQQC